MSWVICGALPNMTEISLADIEAFIDATIGPEFHDKHKAYLSRLSLRDLITRKNPYLFRAKGIEDASLLLRSLIEASLSSSEETLFGNYLETVAVEVAKIAHDGRKSATRELDLEFDAAGTRYIVALKSGPNWGNSSQVARLDSSFRSARQVLRTSGGLRNTPIECIEGCMYGRATDRLYGDRRKLVGQPLWKLLSDGSADLYKTIITPLGVNAKARNDDVLLQMDHLANRLTLQFLAIFSTPEGAINWPLWVEANANPASVTWS